MANKNGVSFTYVELCAGIGGVSFGFDANGGKCVMASEYDPQAKTQFAQMSYKILHPGVDVRGDVREIDERDVPDHDVLSFTVPCQSFSQAGNRRGFDDTRGTLVFEALRIAKHKRPKALFMENVKGLVGHDGGNTLQTIVLAMNEIGYTVDFDVMNSKYFGVPQNRERIFIIAIRDDLITPEPWKINGNSVVAKGKRRIAKIDGVKTFNFDWPEQTEVTTRLRDILEDNVDERYYLSEEKTAKLVAQLNGEMPAHFPTEDDVNNTLRTGGKGSLTAKHNYDHIAESCDPKINVIGTTLTTGAKGTNSRHWIHEADESLIGTIDATTYKQPKQIFGESTQYRIRKLTPLETWRLQGFTDEAHNAVKDAGISDSQRYKQAGNAVTVNVIEALAARLLPYITRA